MRKNSIKLILATVSVLSIYVLYVIGAQATVKVASKVIWKENTIEVLGP